MECVVNFDVFALALVFIKVFPAACAEPHVLASWTAVHCVLAGSTFGYIGKGQLKTQLIVVWPVLLFAFLAAVCHLLTFTAFFTVGWIDLLLARWA